jgi:hypothetical protein
MISGTEQADTAHAEAMAALRRPLRVEDDHVVLRGPPHNLIGVVRLTRSPEPIGAFKTATMDLHETRVGYLQRLTRAPLLSSSLPLDEAVPRHLALDGQLPPGASGRVAVSFAVPATTPPGVYQAVFEFGGETREVEIEVLAEEQLEIRPSTIVLSGRPGEVVSEEMVFVNRGNVPLAFDVLGMLVLQEEEQICLGLQQALAEVQKRQKPEDAHRVFLDTLVASIAERKTDFGRVALDGGPVTIEAGDAASLRVAFHLPRNMVGGRQYEAVLHHRTAQISVQIRARGRPMRETKGKSEAG